MTTVIINYENIPYKTPFRLNFTIFIPQKLDKSLFLNMGKQQSNNNTFTKRIMYGMIDFT